MNGRPLAIEDWAGSVPAIVEAWQPGSKAGLAIADVLFGDYNPSGRLPVSFPRRVGQLPLYYNHKNTGRPSMPPAPGEVYWSHYEDAPNMPLWEAEPGEFLVFVGGNSEDVKQASFTLTP